MRRKKRLRTKSQGIKPWRKNGSSHRITQNGASRYKKKGFSPVLFPFKLWNEVSCCLCERGRTSIRRTAAMKAGFVPKSMNMSLYPSVLKNKEKELAEKEAEIQTWKEKCRAAEKELKKLKNSRSWKMTRFLRKGHAALKNAWQRREKNSCS